MTAVNKRLIWRSHHDRKEQSPIILAVYYILLRYSDASLFTMFLKALLLVFLLFIPTISGQRHLAFTSHLQLEAQDQENLSARAQFTASPTYPLLSTLSVKSRPTTVYRPRSLEVLHRTRLRSLQYAESDLEQVAWDSVEVEGPDIEDLHTLAQLARMSGNAYALPGEKNWYDVDQAWNMVCFVSSHRNASSSDFW